MRINGPISAQRARLLRGQPAGVPYLLVLHGARLAAPGAQALPPQQRGDAACLTLVMAQAFGAPVQPHGAYRASEEDDGPVFVTSA